MGAASDSDGGFRDLEMFREEFDESGIGLGIVGFGAKVDGEGAGGGCGCWGGFDDLFLGGAGFNGDLILIHSVIIASFRAVAR